MKTKIWLGIMFLVLIGMISGDIYKDYQSLNRLNEDLLEALDQKSEEVKRLTGLIENKKAAIKSLEDKLVGFEQTTKDLETKKLLDSQRITSLKNQVKNLTHVNDNQFSLSQLEYINGLIKSRYEYEVLLYEDQVIRPEMSEVDVLERFGQPQSFEVVIDDGSVVGHQAGVYWKRSFYKHFDILYLGDRQGEDYKVHSFATQSSLLTTLHGIRVGDSESKLLKTYSTLVKGHDLDGQTRYVYPDEEYHVEMCFTIENARIIEILYLGYY